MRNTYECWPQINYSLKNERVFFFHDLYLRFMDTSIIHTDFHFKTYINYYFTLIKICSYLADAIFYHDQRLFSIINLRTFDYMICTRMLNINYCNMMYTRDQLRHFFRDES